MKGLSILALTAGLVSAITISPNVQTSVLGAAPVNEASRNAAGQAGSIANTFNSSASFNGSQLGVSDPNFDPASLNLQNLGSVNLGQIDFSDQNSVASGILSMLNVLCAGNLFDLNSILNLGQNNELELFLELVQLMQLEQLGFLNVFDVQALLGSGFGAGFGSGFGGNSNIFNIGMRNPNKFCEHELMATRLLQTCRLRTQEDYEADQAQAVPYQDTQQETVSGWWC